MVNTDQGQIMASLTRGDLDLLRGDLDEVSVGSNLENHVGVFFGRGQGVGIVKTRALETPQTRTVS